MIFDRLLQHFRNFDRLLEQVDIQPKHIHQNKDRCHAQYAYWHNMLLCPAVRPMTLYMLASLI